MANNPMQQFSVYKIGPEIKIAGVDLSFTNASLFMVISASIILLFLFFGTKMSRCQKNVENRSKNKFPRKCLKSISLNSGHLD